VELNIENFRVVDEEKLLRALVNKFGKAMLDKLDKKYSEGYKGWYEDNENNIEYLENALLDHFKKPLAKENLVDIANFCAFLWNIK